MGDVIDINKKRPRAMELDSVAELLLPISWDIDEPGGGPYIALLPAPKGSAGWMLNASNARELAIALLQWAENPEDPDEDCG